MCTTTHVLWSSCSLLGPSTWTNYGARLEALVLSRGTTVCLFLLALRSVARSLPPSAYAVCGIACLDMLVVRVPDCLGPPRTPSPFDSSCSGAATGGGAMDALQDRVPQLASRVMVRALPFKRRMVSSIYGRRAMPACLHGRNRLFSAWQHREVDADDRCPPPGLQGTLRLLRPMSQRAAEHDRLRTQSAPTAGAPQRPRIPRACHTPLSSTSPDLDPDIAHSGRMPCRRPARCRTRSPRAPGRASVSASSLQPTTGG